MDDRDVSDLLNTFFVVATELNVALGSVPVLYGSLGVAVCLDVDVAPRDIDVLVEDDIFQSRATELQATMLRIGFEAVDLLEGEYVRDGHVVGLASDGDLLSFAGIDPGKLRVVQADACYRVLSAGDFVSVYGASSRDGYRLGTRGKKDAEKIALIRAAS